jgi:hypothetical protein
LNKEISGGGPKLDWGVCNLSFHLGLLSDKPQIKKIDSSFLKSVLDKAKPQTGIYDVEEHFEVMLQSPKVLK